MARPFELTSAMRHAPSISIHPSAVQAQPLSRHVGVILDGNRRHARQKQWNDTQQVYAVGANKLDELLTWCVDLRIAAVTLWVLSEANLGRKPDEVFGILAAIESKLLELARSPEIHRQRVRVRAIGRLELLPAPTLAAVRAAEAATDTMRECTLLSPQPTVDAKKSPTRCNPCSGSSSRTEERPPKRSKPSHPKRLTGISIPPIYLIPTSSFALAAR
jgi:undecaprenyl pyrophosphate synthase